MLSNKSSLKSKYSSTLYISKMLQKKSPFLFNKNTNKNTNTKTAKNNDPWDFLATKYIEQLCVTLQRMIVNKRAMMENWEDRIFLKRGFQKNELYFFLDYVRLDTVLIPPLTVGMLLRRQGKTFQTRLNTEIHGVFLKIQQFAQNTGFPLPPNMTISAKVFEHDGWLNVHVILALAV